MSVESAALAMGGLVGGWKLDEASGTTLADFGPNNLPLTLGPQGTLGGTAVVPGVARGVTGSGSVSGLVASRAVGGGTPLQLSPGVTAMAFVRPTVGSPAATKGIISRNTNWQIRHQSNGSIAAFVWVGGAANQITGATTLASGKRYVIAVAYDGVTAELWINGVIDARTQVGGVITATTDALEVLCYSGNNCFQGEGNYALVFNRRLTPGEHRLLVREGDTALDRAEGRGFTDHVRDTQPPVAAAASTRACSVCGGRMRANEQRVANGTADYHPSCRAAVRRSLTIISSSSTQQEIVDRACDFAYETFYRLATRTETEKTVYHDGAKLVAPTLNAAVGGNTVGVGTMLATLARYVRATEDDPLVRYAKQDVEFVRTTIDAAGYVGSDIGDFSLSQMGQTLVMLRGIVNTATWNAWLVDYLRACEFFYTGGTNSVGAVKGAESAWTTNGNREVAETLMYWVAWYLTGNATWQTRFEAQVTWMVGPTGSTSPRSGYVPVLNGGSVHGWRQEVTPVQPDGSDGKGWFREAGANGFYQVNNAGIFLDGLDWNYSALSLQFMLKLWQLSGDSRFLRYSNMLHNKVWERVNTTTAQLDGTSGSRQNVAQPFWTASPHVLTWKGGRADITAANRATLFNLGMVAGQRSAFATPAEINVRSWAYDVGSIIMAAADWPGH